MATRNTAYFVQAVRQLTNTEGDPIVTDPEIADRCSEGKASLYDKIVAAYEHYAVKPFSFTLAGGLTGHTATIPTDFYKDVALTRDPTSAPLTVHRFSSYVDRNNLQARQYIIIDNQIDVSPPALAAGTYRLDYTPLDVPFQAPVVVAPNDLDAVDAFGNWTFTNGAFDQSYVGATCTIVCGAFAIAGTYVVTTVKSSTVVHMTAVPAGAPAVFGTSATNSFQMAGTLDVLPQIFAPWYEYIQVHAAIAVKDKIEQDTQDLEIRLARLEARIDKMVASRMEEGGQIALPSRSGGFFGFSDIPGGG